MHPARIGVIAACLVVACTAPPPPPEPDPVDLLPPPPPKLDLVPPRLDYPAETAVVTLSHEPCPGCAGDTIRLGTDGVLEETTTATPKRAGRVPPILVDMLVRYARDSGYIAAAGRYGAEGGSTTLTTVEVDGQRTEVHDHGDAPTVVHQFEQMVRSAARLGDWGPPVPDERPEMVRRDQCISIIAELEYGTSTEPLPVHISPLGQWPMWGELRPQRLCLDTRAAIPTGKPPGQQFPGLREVTMRRTGCYGPCPSYEVRIRRDGLVFFEGHKYVNRTGVSLGRMAPELVEMLTRYALDTGYPGGKEEHGREVTDVSTIYTSLALDGQRMRTSSIGGSWNEVPATIENFEKMIDAAVTMTDWDVGRPTKVLTGDALREACAPMLAETQRRCGEILDGIGSIAGCFDLFMATFGLKPGAASAARCGYYAGVFPDPPTEAAKPPVQPDARCAPLFATVRARCLDPLRLDIPLAIPAECITWLERMANIAREPEGSAGKCEGYAEELARDLPAPPRRRAAKTVKAPRAAVVSTAAE